MKDFWDDPFVRLVIAYEERKAAAPRKARRQRHALALPTCLTCLGEGVFAAGDGSKQRCECDSDRSGEAIETTQIGSTVGESAGRQASPRPVHRRDHE